MGVKIYPGTSVVHFNLAVGASRASPFHGSLGIGLDLVGSGFLGALVELLFEALIVCTIGLLCDGG